MEIRRIRAGEGAEFRAVRLRALADAPRAYGSTLADSEKLPAEAWEERATRDAKAESNVMYVAVEDGRWYGLAGGYFPPEAEGTAELISVWVDPERRGTGVGAGLIESVIEWARGRGAARIQLWVTKENRYARRLYERAGFADTPETKPLRSNPSIEQSLMARELS